MTIEPGSVVRTLTDLLASDGSVIPIGTTVRVIAYQGEQLVVDWFDLETDSHVTAIAERWDLYTGRKA